MNAVEIEAAVSDLASAPYDASDFPFQFLAAFDKKETTLKRLRKGDSNKSDVPGAVLLVNNIHLATCPAGQTRETSTASAPAPKRPLLAPNSSSPPTALSSKPKMPPARRSPSQTSCPISPIISASSFPSPASQPSARSRTTPSTSGPPAGSTSSTSNSSAPTPTGAPPPAATT